MDPNQIAIGQTLRSEDLGLSPVKLGDRVSAEDIGATGLNASNVGDKVSTEDLQAEGLYEGFVKPTAKAVPRVTGALAGSMALMPGAGISALTKLLPQVSADPDGPLIKSGSLSEAQRVLDEVMELPASLIKTQEETKGIENIGLAMKPIEMSGEGWGLIGRSIDEVIKTEPGTIVLPDGSKITPTDPEYKTLLGRGFKPNKGETLLEPILATIGEVAAMTALPEALKQIKTTTAFRRMNVRERALVIQDLAKVVENNPKMTQAEIIKRWGRQEEAVAARGIKRDTPITDEAFLKDKAKSIPADGVKTVQPGEQISLSTKPIKKELKPWDVLKVKAGKAKDAVKVSEKAESLKPSIQELADNLPSKQAAGAIGENDMINGVTAGQFEDMIESGNVKKITAELDAMKKEGVDVVDIAHPAKIAARLYQRYRGQGLDAPTAKKQAGDIVDNNYKDLYDTAVAPEKSVKDIKVERIASEKAKYKDEDDFIDGQYKKQVRERRAVGKSVAKKLGGKYTRKVKVPEDIASYIGDYGSRITVDGKSMYFIASSENGTIYLPNIAMDKTGSGTGVKFMNALKSFADETSQDISIYKVTNPSFFEKFDWLTKNEYKDFKYNTPVEDNFVGVSDLREIWRGDGAPASENILKNRLPKLDGPTQNTRKAGARLKKENPKQYTTLRSMAGAAAGLGTDDDGNITFDPGKAIIGMIGLSVAAKTISGIGVTSRLKKGPYKGKFLRGTAKLKSKAGLTEKVFKSKIKPEDISPNWDKVANMEEAQILADNFKYVEPLVEDARFGLRYRQDKKTGAYGNDKMKFSNEAYPKGRNTWEKGGCGRGVFAGLNNLEAQGAYGNAAQACYEGKCYAEDLGAMMGRSIARGESPVPLKDKDLRAIIVKHWERKGLKSTQKKWPEWEIRQHRVKKDGKMVDKIGIKKKEAAMQPFAKVSTRLQDAKGQDIRLGVDTDGAAWLANTEVMDAVVGANPRSVTVYSAAYHAPPKPHPLSDRTMINVTVSGWHPLPETLSRIKWAETARDNGWNVILREVTADPSKFTNAEAARYNRIHEAVMSTDFLVMEQPLHKGATHGGPAKGLPACCQSKVRLHTCDSCEVAEGLGKGFKDFYGLKEIKTKILPGIK